MRFPMRLAQILKVSDPEEKSNLDYHDTLVEDFLTNLNVYNQAQRIVNMTTSTYAVVASDIGALFRCSSTTTVSLSLPQDSSQPIDKGKYVEAFNVSTGTVQFISDGTSTVNGYPTALTGGQRARLFAQKTAANEWTVGGATHA